MTPNISSLPCTVAWQRIMDNQSHEQASLVLTQQGYRFTGIVLAAEAGVPLRIIYALACDTSWKTLACEIQLTFGMESRTLSLENENGCWLVNGAPDSLLNGLCDVDLGISPSTNALPINRLDLDIGCVGEMKAVWVKFPELSISVAAQSYERVSERRYLYKNLDSDFKAAIDVDDAGLAIAYEGIWQRIAYTRGNSLSELLG